MTKQSTNLLTEGVIWKKIILFALPMFFGNLFQQLYNIVDSLVVGNFLGSDALAAVGSSGSLIFLLVGFFYGTFSGAGVVIARYYGARDREKVSSAIHTALAFAICAGIVLSIIGVIFAPLILRLMGTPESVLPQSIHYLRTYFAGITAVVLFNAVSGIFQAMGDSKSPLKYLITASVINVVLDFLFVAVLPFGVAGAAFATMIAQAVSAGLGLYKLSRKENEFPVMARKIRFDVPMLKQILRLGLPSGVQNSIIAFANVIVQSNINAFGAAAVAGCGTYSKIEGFGFLPITCFAMAITTFISQNLGAGQFERAKRGTHFAMVLSPALAELVGICIYVFSPFLISLFNSEPAVVEFGTLQARTVTLFYFLLAFSHCIAGILRGAGKSIVPMIVMLVSWCVIRITYITVAVHFIPQIRIVFWAYPLTWSISSVIFLIYYLKADWLHGFEKKKR